MTASRWVASVALLTVVGGVLAGLYLSGSPSEQRLLRLDEKRSNDLSQLARSISYYRQKHDQMPESLEDLVDGQMLNSLPLDPVTGAAYLLQLTEGDSYRLCANFARPSVQMGERQFWAHPSGLHCFTFSSAVDSSGRMLQPFNGLR